MHVFFLTQCTAKGCTGIKHGRKWYCLVKFCYVLWRISVKARLALWLSSELPSSFLRRACLIGSLEFAHSLSGAAFLDITWRFTSLVGCLRVQENITQIPAVSIVKWALSLAIVRERLWVFSRYLKCSRENSFSVAGANLSNVPVSFLFACMMFFRWLGDRLRRLWNKENVATVFHKG